MRITLTHVLAAWLVLAGIDAALGFPAHRRLARLGARAGCAVVRPPGYRRFDCASRAASSKVTWAALSLALGAAAGYVTFRAVG